MPEGEVPYTPNDAPVGTDHTRLEQEYRGLYRFVKGGADNLPSLKRESMFVQLLEGLAAEEAELVCLVKIRLLVQSTRGLLKQLSQKHFHKSSGVLTEAHEGH